MSEEIINVEVEETEETIEEPKGIFVKAGIAVQDFVDNTGELIRNNWKKILLGGVIASVGVVGTAVGIGVLGAANESDDDYDYDDGLEVEVVTEIPDTIEVDSTTETEDSDD